MGVKLVRQIVTQINQKNNCGGICAGVVSHMTAPEANAFADLN
jgi:hypothetical protein